MSDPNPPLSPTRPPASIVSGQNIRLKPCWKRADLAHKNKRPCPLTAKKSYPGLAGQNTCLKKPLAKKILLLPSLAKSCPPPARSVEAQAPTRAGAPVVTAQQRNNAITPSLITTNKNSRKFCILPHRVKIELLTFSAIIWPVSTSSESSSFLVVEKPQSPQKA